jgi:hypothetical protein
MLFMTQIDRDFGFPDKLNFFAENSLKPPKNRDYNIDAF